MNDFKKGDFVQLKGFPGIKILVIGVNAERLTVINPAQSLESAALAIDLFEEYQKQ